MKDNPLKKLGTLGQSIWLDFIRRDLITGGELRWILKGGIEMTDHQIAAKVRECLHKRSLTIGWRSNPPTQYDSKTLLVISS